MMISLEICVQETGNPGKHTHTVTPAAAFTSAGIFTRLPPINTFPTQYKSLVIPKQATSGICRSRMRLV